MPTPIDNPDLHGNAPDNAPVALVLIDVINDLEFEGGEDLLETALPLAHRLRELRRRAREHGIPTIFANDNFGRWRSDFNAIVGHCTADDVRGCEISRLVQPDADDYFILKPKHSAFYETPLDLLLRYLGSRTLILAGLTGDRCVLFTAADAFLRDYRLVVPSDGCASIVSEENDGAIDQIGRLMKADTTPIDQLDLAELQRTARS